MRKKTDALNAQLQKTIDSVPQESHQMMAFLLQNTFLYKYTIREILYIHGQQPEATFVATYPEWQTLNRYVKKGSTAIRTVINSQDPDSKHMSLFDVSQTKGTELRLYDWATSEKMALTLLDSDKVSYKFESLSTFMSLLFKEKRQNVSEAIRPELVSLLSSYTMSIKLSLPLDPVLFLEQLQSLTPTTPADFFVHVDVANQLVKVALSTIKATHFKLSLEEKALQAMDSIEKTAVINSSWSLLEDPKDIEVVNDTTYLRRGQESDYPPVSLIETDVPGLSFYRLENWQSDAELIRLNDLEEIALYENGWDELDSNFYGIVRRGDYFALLDLETGDLVEQAVSLSVSPFGGVSYLPLDVIPTIKKEQDIEQQEPVYQEELPAHFKGPTQIHATLLDTTFHLSNSIAIFNKKGGSLERLERRFELVESPTATLFDITSRKIIETYSIEAFKQLIDRLKIDDSPEMWFQASKLQKGLQKYGVVNGGQSLLFSSIQRHYYEKEKLEAAYNRLSIEPKLIDIDLTEPQEIYGHPSYFLLFNEDYSELTLMNTIGKQVVYTWLTSDDYHAYFDVNHDTLEIHSTQLSKESLLDDFKCAVLADTFIFSLHPGFFEKHFDLEAQLVVEDPLVAELSLFDASFLSELDSPQQLEQQALDTSKKEQVTNFSFPSANFYPESKKDKMGANIEALELLQKLTTTHAQATPEEQLILAKYVGWGGLFEIFDDRTDLYKAERRRVQMTVTPEEYRQMVESVLTAYYTDPLIISEIYQKIADFGFESGTILDPSMGTGNFFSAMPEDMRKQSDLYGVELDSITGKLAKHLHPSASIQVQGFETTEFSEGSFDLVIGNIPFNNFTIQDKQYKKDYLIHDYFIKKSLDLTREGGIVAFISSSGTLDKGSTTSRLEFSKEADLLGAVRLPNTAFKRLAGTEVTTDILFFQKNTAKKTYSPDWVYTGSDRALPTVTYNNYFIKQPSQVLGDFVVQNYHGQTLTVEPKKGEDLYALLEKGLKTIDGSYLEAIGQRKLVLPLAPISDELPILDVNPIPSLTLEDVPFYTFTVVEESLYFRNSSETVKTTLPKATTERIVGMSLIRDSLQEVIDIQLIPDYSDTTLQTLQNELNDRYDSFIAKHGYLNHPANKNAFAEDDGSPLVLSLESKNEDDSYSKSAIMSTATIRPKTVVTEVATAKEALTQSIVQKQRIDFEFMSTLYKTATVEQMIEELGSDIYINPEKFSLDAPQDYWETKDEYLTGDVRQKLDQAEAVEKSDPDRFSRNVEALKRVMPEDLKISDIDFKIGATWIPQDVYYDFMTDIFEMAAYAKRLEIITIEHNQFNGRWFIKGKNSEKTAITTNRYGTTRANAYSIFEDTLNLKSVQVKDPVDDGYGNIKYVLNPKETMIARSRQTTIQRAFKDWLFQDKSRADSLLTLYNETFNRFRPRVYDGSV